jgi:hypothetical protein
MDTNKVIYAIYNDDEILMDAVKQTRAAHHHIEEIYTPFPVHGLDKAMGLSPTRIAICSFLFGVLGLSTSIWLMNNIMISDWPQDIGGKPSFSYLQNMPAFVPIMFEMTVFFAAHLMVITFYMRSKLWPFKQPENPDLRTTGDHFLMEVSVGANEDDMVSFFKSTGAIEVKVIEKHEKH